MESTGKAGAIQVTQETRQILQQFGYTFIERGLVMVKGKGELLTFYLQGKGATPTAAPPPPVKAIETQPNECETDTNTQLECPPPASSQPARPTLQQTLSTESPAHLTSLSSSTASPNSVRLNQDFVESKNGEVTAIELKSTGDAAANNVSDDNADAQTPLLSSHQSNPNHVDSNHFSIGEKDALLENAN